MPVTTDDLRAAVTSLYPDNVSGEIDAADLRTGMRFVADVIDEVPPNHWVAQITEAEYDAAILARDQAQQSALDALSAVPWSVDSVTALLAGTTSYAIGGIIVAKSGQAFTVLAAAATGQPQTAAPAYLRVRPNENGEFPATAWGVQDITTDQRAKIASMLTSGEKAFNIPQTNNRIAMDGGAAVFAGQKIRGGRFDQKTKYTQTFDILKGQDGCELRDMDFIGSYERSYVGDSFFRQERSYSQSAAIWCGSSGNRFDNIKVVGGNCGIFMSAYDAATNTQNMASAPIANKITRLWTEDVWGGVLALGQQLLEVHQHYSARCFQDALDVNLPHAIYITGSDVIRSKNVHLSGLTYDGFLDRSLKGANGSAWSLRYTDGLLVNGAISRYSPVMTLTSLTDAIVSGVVGRECFAGESLAALNLYATSDLAVHLPKRVKIEADIQMRENGGRVLNFYGDDCSLDLKSHQWKTSAPAGADFQVTGSRNYARIENTDIAGAVNNGASTVYLRTLSPAVTVPDANVIEFIGDANASSVLNIESAATNTQVKADWDRIRKGGTNQSLFNTSGVMGTNTTVLRPKREKRTTAFAETMTGEFNPHTHTDWVLTIPDAGNYQVSAPATGNSPVGTQIRIVIRNGTAGVLGNIYWSGAWQLNAGTPTKPIAGRSISADFRWDGAGWQQI